MSVKTHYGIVWKHIVLIRMHYGNINLRIMDTEKNTKGIPGNSIKGNTFVNVRFHLYLLAQHDSKLNP